MQKSFSRKLRTQFLSLFLNLFYIKAGLNYIAFDLNFKNGIFIHVFKMLYQNKYFACLSGWVSVCLFVFNKCGTSRDPREGLWMIEFSKICLLQNSIFCNLRIFVFCFAMFTKRTCSQLK